MYRFARNHRVRPHLGQRLQHKQSLTHPRMRQRQIRRGALVMHHDVTKEQQVKIKRARPPSLLGRTISTMRHLDAKQRREQATRREACRDAHARVQIHALHARPHRRSLMQSRSRDNCRHGQGCNRRDRAAKRLLAIAKIAPHRDSGVDRERLIASVTLHAQA